MNAPRQFLVTARITKVDEEKRLVTGVITSEAVDKSGERLDYTKSKPAFKSWMEEFQRATGGRSKGNLREMHGKVAAGLFVDLEFDDVSKQIIGTAKVVDDAAWEKTKNGVYTGFSIGGNYGETWQDPENPKVLVFAPSEIVETSLVDNPCNPEATFIAVKSDGKQELRKFVSVEAFNPDEADEVEQGWKAKDGSFHPTKKAAVRHNIQTLAMKAAADIAAPAEASLAALKKDVGDALAAADAPAEGAEAAAATTDATTAPVEAVVEVPVVADATPMAEPALTPAATPEPEAPAPVPTEAPAPAEVPGTEAAKVTKSKLVRLTPTEDIKKGMCAIGDLADLIQMMSWLRESLAWEAVYEDDASPLPAELKGIIDTLCTFLMALVAEETAELVDSEMVILELAAMPLPKLSAILKAAKSANAVDVLVKAIGHAAKNPAPQLPEGEAALDKVTAERDAMRETLETTVKSTTDTVKKLQADLETIKQMPIGPKGFLRAVTVGKGGGEGAAASSTGGKPTVEAVQAQLKALSPQDAALLLMKEAALTRSPAAPTL